MTHVLIVCGRFYEDIADELTNGARVALAKANVTFDVMDVPGALEIPAAIRYALVSNRYDGYVALGCVIRGETSHYDIVCNESARALSLLNMQFCAAIGNGILTVENKKQALARARVKEGNKGASVVEACLRLIELKEIFGVKPAEAKS